MQIGTDELEGILRRSRYMPKEIVGAPTLRALHIVFGPFDVRKAMNRLEAFGASAEDVTAIMERIGKYLTHMRPDPEVMREAFAKLAERFLVNFRLGLAAKRFGCTEDRLLTLGKSFGCNKDGTLEIVWAYLMTTDEPSLEDLQQRLEQRRGEITNGRVIISDVDDADKEE